MQNSHKIISAEPAVPDCLRRSPRSTGRINALAPEIHAHWAIATPAFPPHHAEILPEFAGSACLNLFGGLIKLYKLFPAMDPLTFVF